MRFSLLPFSIVVVTSATDSPCSEEVVRNAESQGLFSYIYNCVYDHATSPGPQACLAEFIAANSVSNSFPLVGSCRDTYQNFVTGVYLVAPLPLIPTTIDAGAIPKSVISIGVLAGFINSFYTATGFYPFRMCSGAQVRAAAVAGAFEAIVGQHWVSSAAWVGITDLPACQYCYTGEFASDIGSAPSFNSGNNGLVAECVNVNGPSETCLASTIMIDARQGFIECAGYDILWEGPACTSTQVAEVQTLIPAPYYTFAECAYRPATSFCQTIQSYFNAIKTDTNSIDCLACYTELQTALEALASNDINNVCGPDVFADTCLAYQASALSAFEVCAGTTLNTDAATVAPVTTAVPITAATTAGATSAATTTVASTTTKNALVTSVAGMLCFVAILS